MTYRTFGRRWVLDGSVEPVISPQRDQVAAQVLGGLLDLSLEAAAQLEHGLWVLRRRGAEHEFAADAGNWAAAQAARRRSTQRGARGAGEPALPHRRRQDRVVEPLPPHRFRR